MQQHAPTHRRRRLLAWAVAAGGLALLAVAAAWHARQDDSSLLRPDDAPLVARGSALYANHCAACHGERLQGQPRWREPGPDGLLPAPPHDASGHTWHHPDGLLFAITKYGVARAANLPEHRSAMPAYEGILADEEIVAVLSWIKAQWPAPVRRHHDEINEAAARAGH